MNEAQQIFTIFFAISWGTMSNVLPRWKPFHYAALGQKDVPQARYRLILAIILFNFVPWVMFAVVLFFLKGDSIKSSDWTLPHAFLIVIIAILPGLTPYACYRLWLTIIHWWPTCFYVENEEALPEDLRGNSAGSPYEPTRKYLGIKDYGSKWDFRAALIYLGVLLFPAIYWAIRNWPNVNP